jgi:hypothetical protein
MKLSNPNHIIMGTLLLMIPTLTVAYNTTGKHALLIGIQDYSTTPDFHSLKAPARDIRLMTGVLQARFQFQRRDIIILQDADATHTGIEKAFAELNKRVRHGDFVYIHYSGHGSLTHDCNGDEPTGQDQTWVPYGARSGNKPQHHKDDYDILDDEILAWLAPIYAKTDQIVFVSDSCHSGTVSRGETSLVKAVPPDTRRHLFCRQPYPRWVSPRGIRIGAARDDQSAIETAFKTHNGSQSYSLFTRAWATTLQKAQRDDTWYDIFKRSYDKITALREKAQSPTFSRLSQQPQLEGRRRHLALTRGFSPKQPTVKIKNVLGSRVQLNAGYADGVTKGSVYRLHRPGYSKPQNLPYLTIERVGDFQSFGKATGRFTKRDLVIEQEHAYPFQPIKVYLKADRRSLFNRDIRLLQTIRSAFYQNKFPAYRLTYNSRHAEQLLYLLRSGYNNALELWILTPEGRLLHEHLKIPFRNQNRGLKLLQHNLNKLARIRELKLLGTDRYENAFVGKLQIWHTRPVNYCQPDPSSCIHDREYGKYYRIIAKSNLTQFQEYASHHSVQQQDVLMFGLHNTSGKDYYFYLIEISPDGTIQSLFPSSDEAHPAYSKVRAGKRQFRIPRLALTQTGKATLKLIATRQPIEVSLLEESHFARSGTRTDLNPLERLLFNAMQGKRTRVGIPTGFQWATEQVSFEVK